MVGAPGARSGRRLGSAVLQDEGATPLVESHLQSDGIDVRVQESADGRMQRSNLVARPSPYLIERRRRPDSQAGAHHWFHDFLGSPASFDGPHMQSIGRVDDNVSVGRRRKVLVVDHVGPE